MSKRLFLILAAVLLSLGAWSMLQMVTTDRQNEETANRYLAERQAHIDELKTGPKRTVEIVETGLDQYWHLSGAEKAGYSFSEYKAAVEDIAGDYQHANVPWIE